MQVNLLLQNNNNNTACLKKYTIHIPTVHLTALNVMKTSSSQ